MEKEIRSFEVVDKMFNKVIVSMKDKIVENEKYLVQLDDEFENILDIYKNILVKLLE